VTVFSERLRFISSHARSGWIACEAVFTSPDPLPHQFLKDSEAKKPTPTVLLGQVADPGLPRMENLLDRLHADHPVLSNATTDPNGSPSH